MRIRATHNVRATRASSFACGALVVAAAVSCVACGDRNGRALDRADDLAFEGRYEEAVDVLDQVLSSLRETREAEELAVKVRALTQAGQISHLFLREPERALAYYRRLAELAPGSDEAFDARERMARIHLEVGDRSGAITHFQALVTGFGDREGIDGFQYELARAYFAAGDSEQARTESRHLLERWPDSDYADRVRMLVARAHQVENDLEEALEAYRVARRKADDPVLGVRALFEEAGCLAALGRKDEAVAAYVESLESHPEPRLVRMRLDRLRKRMARRDVDNLGAAW